MSKTIKEQGWSGHGSAISKKTYKDTLRKLQVELVKLQRHFIKCNDKILIILEGRDAAGKGTARSNALSGIYNKDRKSDPLKQWKVSPIDEQAVKYWKAYSRARNEMLARTHNPMAPWTLVRANDKRLTRLNIIMDLLSRLHYADKDERLIRTDPRIVFPYDVSHLENGQLTK